MNLYIDVGNTASKFAVNNLEELSLIFVIDTKKLLSDPSLLEEVIKDKKIENAYISTVVPAIKEVFESFFKEKNINIDFISPLDDAGLKINIDYPEELGTDLLCDLAGGYQLYSSPLLIIDLGTATKFLFIDNNGVFSTCAFVPGLELTLKTLNSNTALLPKIDIGEIKPLLDCHNTKDVLMASTYYSHIDMINGMVNRYQKEVGYPFKIVMSGGNAIHIKEKMNFEYEIKQNLCLIGIKIIADRK